jgi:YHS domain-containing protein
MFSLLLRIFSLVFVLYLLKRFLAVILGKPKPPGQGAGSIRSTQKMVKDPVCGMYMDSRLAVRMEDKKEILYFCSDECKNKYMDKTPGTGAASNTAG